MLAVLGLLTEALKFQSVKVRVQTGLRPYMLLGVAERSKEGKTVWELLSEYWLEFVRGYLQEF